MLSSRTYHHPRAADKLPGRVPSSPIASDREIDEGLLPVPAHTLAVPRDDILPAGDVKINDLQYIGSYNWVKGSDDRGPDKPTILVPGSPPEWNNTATPYSVPPDHGKTFVDQNGFWLPSASLAPLVIAVNTHQTDTGQPKFDWSLVDIITDRNGLRKLLRWITGRAEKDFRIDLQLAGNHTVLFNRWEKRTREEASGFTYGFNFENKAASQAKDCEESLGHHRIVNYDMNGLKIVLRFEVDACLSSATAQNRSRTFSRGSSSDINELVSAFETTKISRSEAPSTKLSAGDTILTVRKGGSVVPQSSLIELATVGKKRLERNQYTWPEVFPQLFLSQTPHHFLGVHQSGHFMEVQKRKLQSDPELLRLERESQGSFRKLRAVLDQIKKLVVEAGEQGRFSLVCRNGNLQMFERKSDDSCLPASFMQQFK